MPLLYRLKSGSRPTPLYPRFRYPLLFHRGTLLARGSCSPRRPRSARNGAHEKFEEAPWIKCGSASGEVEIREFRIKKIKIKIKFRSKVYHPTARPFFNYRLFIVRSVSRQKNSVVCAQTRGSTPPRLQSRSPPGEAAEELSRTLLCSPRALTAINFNISMKFR